MTDVELLDLGDRRHQPDILVCEPMARMHVQAQFTRERRRPAEPIDLFEALPEAAFRADVSSTEIRAGWDAAEGRAIGGTGGR